MLFMATRWGSPSNQACAPLLVVRGIAMRVHVRVLILIDFVEVEGVGVGGALMHVETQATGFITY